MTIDKSDYKWYAVYTAPRAEKKVRDRFLEKGIEHYLPIQIVERQWHDRIKKIEQPVLNGYIFVFIPPQEMTNVLMTYGAIAFVKERTLPVAIPTYQIETLRTMVDKSEDNVEFTLEQLEPGATVRINAGKLCGTIGELIEIKGKYKVLIRMDGLGCATTTVSLSCVEKL